MIYVTRQAQREQFGNGLSVINYHNKGINYGAQ